MASFPLGSKRPGNPSCSAVISSTIARRRASNSASVVAGASDAASAAASRMIFIESVALRAAAPLPRFTDERVARLFARRGVEARAIVRLRELHELAAPRLELVLAAQAPRPLQRRLTALAREALAREAPLQRLPCARHRGHGSLGDAGSPLPAPREEIGERREHE